MTFAFGKVVDSLIAFRMVKILVQDWTDMDAFKLGIIDKDGEFLKKTRELKTAEEKKAFTKFHVIMFRLKKLIQKIPFGKNKLGSLAVALMLLKEETGNQTNKMVETVIWAYVKEFESTETINNLCEQADMECPVLLEGTYILKEETLSTDGDVIAVGTPVIIEELVDTVFGVTIFEAKTEDGQTVYVEQGCIEQC